MSRPSVSGKIKILSCNEPDLHDTSQRVMPPEVSEELLQEYNAAGDGLIACARPLLNVNVNNVNGAGVGVGGAYERYPDAMVPHSMSVLQNHHHHQLATMNMNMNSLQQQQQQNNMNRTVLVHAPPPAGIGAACFLGQHQQLPPLTPATASHHHHSQAATMVPIHHFQASQVAAASAGSLSFAASIQAASPYAPHPYNVNVNNTMMFHHPTSAAGLVATAHHHNGVTTSNGTTAVVAYGGGASSCAPAPMSAASGPFVRY